MSTEYTYENKIEFIKKLYCAARMVSDETGASWELILAQAAQETGWGEKVLPGTNNVFNIKADSSWDGPSKVFNVWEMKNGKKVWQDDPFRVYANYTEALRDRVKFLKENPRYGKAGLFDPGVKGNLEKEAQALQKAGYATDPNYAESLAEVAHGKTMKRAIKEAQAAGCGPVLPVVEIILLDGARVAIAKAKVAVTQNGKSAEILTDSTGRLLIRITPNSGDITLKVFDADQHQWIALDPVPIPKPAKSTTVTLIAPTFTVHTTTREHDKKPAPKAAPPAPPPTPTASELKRFEMHKIKPGESLAIIGKQYKVSYKAIADANHIASPYIIRAGEMLKIPKAAMPGAAPSAHAEPGMLASAQKTLQEVIAKSENALHAVFYRNPEKKPQTDVMHASRAPWMKAAEEEFQKGVKRQMGSKNNDENILNYFSATSLGKQKVDEVPYCAAFVNWCLAKSGYKGNNSARAVDFMKWGRPTKGNKPALGAVAVIHWKEGGHHVTFVAGASADGKRISTLGGNQGKGHEVSHSYCGTGVIIGYRYPADYPHNEDDYVLHDVKSDSAPMGYAATH